MPMINELRTLVGDAMFNIDQFRSMHPDDSLASYDDGRYDAYFIVMGWINQIERRNNVPE
jgi:hypothetical protein